MIRRLLLLLAFVCGLGLVLPAQSLLTVGVGKGNNAAAVVATTGIGPVDTLTDLHTTTNGTALTTALFDAGTRGNANHGGWTKTGTGLTAATHVSNCTPLGAMQVDGTVYATSNTSLAMAIDNSGTVRHFQATAPTPTGYLTAVMLACVTLNTGVLGGSGLWDLMWFQHAGGGLEVVQFSTSKCAGTAGIDLETINGGTVNSTCITTGFAVGTSYWICLLSDGVTGIDKLAVFDGVTGAQVGSTLTGSQVTGDPLSLYGYGQREFGTSTGSNTIENVMVRWSGNAPFPLGPANTTQDPVYWIAKSLNNGAGASTSIATTKAVDVPAGSTIVVAVSAENDAMTVSGVVDTGSTNTLTNPGGSCRVGLATQGAMEVWTKYSATAKTGDLFTATLTSSSFRNIAVMILSAGTADICASGTTAAGGADLASSNFTPTVNASAIFFGYITAGAAYTAGTNYRILNTSSATSFAAEWRASLAGSSQQATLIQADTSSKWGLVQSVK